MADKAKTHRVATSDDIEVSTYLEIAKELQGEQFAAPEAISPAKETVAIIDFGSQYSHLIARRVRECHVYCELVPCDAPWERITALQPKGFILSGGPASVYQEGAPLTPLNIYESRLPILGICYGMQVLAHQLGGQVSPGIKREYGQAILHTTDDDSPLFAGLPRSLSVWMSHGDEIVELPPGFKALAHTENSPNAVIGNGKNIFGLQFHPEVVHTPQGKNIIQNFLYQVCGCQGTWTAGNFINESVTNIREQVKDGKVICALSGGVDSAVAATLIHRAIGNQLTCIFVNNGLLRREEPERALNTFRNNLNM
ncbi:MAG: glutamine-hydrolyzing GMP synthase, partial [Chloroflexi bacterium]|nr:glutamine-hydrolyzing GMP synthase [Chloroflexota bacterium]